MNQSQILDFLGLQGGRPLDAVPTIQIADFSETAVGEFIESRGLAGAQHSTNLNFTFNDFYLYSRAGGGLVVSDLRVATYGDVGTALSIVYNGLTEASWLAQLFPLTPAALNGALAEVDKLDVGSQPSTSGLFSATGPEATLAAGAVVLPTTRLASGIGGIGDVHSFTLQPGVRWFVAPGTGLRLFANSRPTGGTAHAEVSVTWRELAPVTRG